MIYSYDGIPYSNKNKGHATIWVNLRKIMLSESNHIQKVTYSILPFTLDAKPAEQIDTIRRYSSFQWELE